MDRPRGMYNRRNEKNQILKVLEREVEGGKEKEGGGGRGRV